MSKPEVVFRARWAAVKKNKDDGFDVWRWNLYKMKWTRVADAAGFGHFDYARDCALELSNEVQVMLDNNRTPPEPLQ